MPEGPSLLTHLASLSAFLAFAMACGAPPPPPSPMTELARLVREGKLSGAIIEYWVGGGIPPPYYRSDQFRLLTRNTGDTLLVARPYRDPVARREGLVEQYQIPALPADVQRVAKLILDSGIFDPRFAGEKDPGMADAPTTEVIVTIAGQEYKRRFFSASPQPLEPLRLEVENLAGRVVAGGEREVFRPGQDALPEGPEPAAETIPLAQQAGEAARRVLHSLPATGKLVLWINVSVCDPCKAAAVAVRGALEKDPRLLFAEKIQTGAVAVPSGVPGEHVHMLVYRVEPHPDLVLDISEIRGRLSFAARDAGRDPLTFASRWRWILSAP